MSAATAAGQRGSFDRLLADLSARFVSLSADEVEGAILDALGRIGSFLDVDRVGLLRRRPDRALVVRHCWSPPGVEPIGEGRVMEDPLPRVFERLKAERGQPDMLRVDNGPEFLGQVFVDWCQANGMFIDYIEPGKPNQNAFIERFNRSLRNEVLDLYLFRNLAEAREIVSQWRKQYNEDRPHDALGGLPPIVYAQRNLENSTFELST